MRIKVKDSMVQDLLPVLVSLCDQKQSKSGSIQRPNRDKMVNLVCQILSDEAKGNSELRSLILKDESLVSDLETLDKSQKMEVDEVSEVQMIDTSENALKFYLEKEKREKSDAQQRIGQIKTSLVLIGFLRIMCS